MSSQFFFFHQGYLGPPGSSAPSWENSGYATDASYYPYWWDPVAGSCKLVGMEHGIEILGASLTRQFRKMSDHGLFQDTFQMTALNAVTNWELLIGIYYYVMYLLGLIM